MRSKCVRFCPIPANSCPDALDLKGAEDRCLVSVVHRRSRPTANETHPGHAKSTSNAPCPIHATSFCRMGGIPQNSTSQLSGNPCFFLGHDFSRGEDAAKSNWALQVAERLARAAICEGLVSGHDFSRAAIAAKQRGLYRLRKNSCRSCHKRQGTTLVVP